MEAKIVNQTKQIKELKANPNNIITDFSSPNEAVEAIERIKGDDENQVGYLIIEHFNIDPYFLSRLPIENDLALAASRHKIRSLFVEHFLTAEEIYNAIEKASSDPLIIVYDSNRNSHQFYVEIEAKEYRAIFEFGVFLDGIKIVKANILASVFREGRFLHRLKKIEQGEAPGLTLLYKKGEGWKSTAS